jgi:hypothetical protein
MKGIKGSAKITMNEHREISFYSLIDVGGDLSERIFSNHSANRHRPTMQLRLMVVWREIRGRRSK